MGMGEPLANEAACGASVERIHDDVGLGARHLTVSTVGVVPGIAKLADWPLPVNLAVSLHAANDELRNEMVPINRRYPLAMLMDGVRRLPAREGAPTELRMGADRRHQRPRQRCTRARRAVPGLPLAAHVNLIPLNPTPGYLTRGTSLKRVHEFRDRLEQLGVNATVRRNRGTDIDAACGQLAAGQEPRPITLGRRLDD